MDIDNNNINCDIINRHTQHSQSQCVSPDIMSLMSSSSSNALMGCLVDDEETVVSSCRYKYIEVADSHIEQLQAMKRREGDYKVGDYLTNRHHKLARSASSSAARTSSSLSPAVVDGEYASPFLEPIDVDCRYRMCEWSFAVVDHYQFERQTVGIAMNLLDRFLNNVTDDDDHDTISALTDRSTFRLAAMTCLYTAIKIAEPYKLSIDAMASLGRNSYSKRQIEDMERTILTTNRWLLHPPTASMFGHVIARWLSSVDDRYDLDTLLELVNVQLDAAILDYELSCSNNRINVSQVVITPSMVALCAVQNAMEGMNVASLEEQEVFADYLAGILIHNDEEAQTTVSEEDIAFAIPSNLLCSQESVIHPTMGVNMNTTKLLMQYIRHRLYEVVTGPATQVGVQPLHEHHRSQTNGHKVRCNKTTNCSITCGHHGRERAVTTIISTIASLGNNDHDVQPSNGSPVTVAEETESATKAMVRTSLSSSSVYGHCS